MRNWHEHEDFDRDLKYAEALEDDEGEQPETFGCLFPCRCLMPGLHFPSECYTIEMIEAIEAERGGDQ